MQNPPSSLPFPEGPYPQAEDGGEIQGDDQGDTLSYPHDGQEDDADKQGPNRRSREVDAIDKASDPSDLHPLPEIYLIGQGEVDTSEKSGRQGEEGENTFHGAGKGGGEGPLVEAQDEEEAARGIQGHPGLDHEQGAQGPGDPPHDGGDHPSPQGKPDHVGGDDQPDGIVEGAADDL